MVFSSIIFLTFFLPLSLAFYYLLPKKYRFSFVLIPSLLFYGWGDFDSIWVITISVATDYFCAKKIYEYIGQGKKDHAKKFLILSILVNIGLLTYFKYTNFLAENLLLLGVVIPDHISDIALPLGISFYTFQSLSYSIDVYNGVVKPAQNFLRFASYVTLFPQLIAGPIVRYSDLHDQVDDGDGDIINLTDRLYYGACRFSFGLGKKVLIANNVGSIADTIFQADVATLGMAHAWLGVLAYSLQIYYDFSGYSDMAIGLGMMLGLRFPENFNYPYSSRSITEFWRKWHISLSTWWRDYVYIPLGGNKKGRVKLYRNLLMVFFLCGLWHGANWTFVAWGLFHGGFLILERAVLNRYLGLIPRLFQHLYTLVVIAIGWAIFRSSDLLQAEAILMKLLGISEMDGSLVLPVSVLGVEEVLFLALGVLFSYPFKYFSLLGERVAFSSSFSLVLYILSLAYLSVGGYNPFLYFRF